jgi:hypothetical protein
MANPTSNYGFVLPTSSDLVTDLPADFDVALQGVDTRLKALNPATTLGDLNYASATANTNTRLGVGSSGQVLTVSGGVPAWTTPSSGSMTLLSTTSLTGSSVSLSSISQGYKDLRLELTDVTFSTNASSVLVRFNGDTGTNYEALRFLSHVGVTDVFSSVQATSINMTSAYDMWNASVDSVFMYQLFNYTDTTAIRCVNAQASFQKPSSTQGDRILEGRIGFYKNVGTAISSISIAISAGTFSTGTAKLWGVI